MEPSSCPWQCKPPWQAALALGWPRAGDPSGRHRIGQAADGAEEEQVEVGEFDEGERAAEREVDGEADEEDPP